jgi:hypothetical protein
MVRRLAEATKACRARRTRGDIGLCFFLALVEATAFFLVITLFPCVFLAEVLFAGVRLTDELLAGVLFAAVLSVEDGWDWAATGATKPSQGRKNNPAKTATAKLRTQTLPSAESWHP